MEIKTETNFKTVLLNTLDYGDVFTTPNTPEPYYIVIEPNYELNTDEGIYCVNLKSGTLYCFEEYKDVIPVEFSATTSY